MQFDISNAPSITVWGARGPENSHKQGLTHRRFRRTRCKRLNIAISSQPAVQAERCALTSWLILQRLHQAGPHAQSAIAKRYLLSASDTPFSRSYAPDMRSTALPVIFFASKRLHLAWWMRSSMAYLLSAFVCSFSAHLSSLPAS